MRLVAIAHIVAAVLLSLGAFIVPRVITLEQQRQVEVVIYGGAIALFFALVAVGIAAYAKERRVLWAAIASTVLTAALTFVALWRLAA